MAKSFKQLAPTPTVQKRTSEKDIFDFLEEKPIATPSNQAQDNTSNTSNTKGKASGNKRSINSSAAKSVEDVSSVTNVTNEEVDVRQTFIIGEQYLNRLKDFVHTKRVAGQYEYTQKQALHEALDRLFEGATIEERPAHIRQQEEARKQRIRRGITK